MSRTQVIVIGGSGMLGSALVDVLGRDPSLDLWASYRNNMPTPSSTPLHAGKWFRFEAGGRFPPLMSITKDTWIVNAAGLIRHRMDDSKWSSIAAAVRANVELPICLAKISEQFGCRLIQIGTDCVFSGRSKDFYKEDSPHDALFAYGKTKSLGEIEGPNALNLRCSIIGRELFAPKFGLMEWVLEQDQGATITGYKTHYWNGVTTNAFAKVAHGLISNPARFFSGTQHLVPKNGVTKSELVRLIAEAFGRLDLQIDDGWPTPPVNRGLETRNPDRNWVLWQVAGYESPPTIKDMVYALAKRGAA